MFRSLQHPFGESSRRPPGDLGFGALPDFEVHEAHGAKGAAKAGGRAAHPAGGRGKGKRTEDEDPSSLEALFSRKRVTHKK